MNPVGAGRLLLVCAARAMACSACLAGIPFVIASLAAERRSADFGFIAAYAAVVAGIVALPCGLAGGLVALGLVGAKKREWRHTWTAAGALTGAAIPAGVLLLMLSRARQDLPLVLGYSGFGAVVGAAVAASLARELELMWLACPARRGVHP